MPALTHLSQEEVEDILREARPLEAPKEEKGSFQKVREIDDWGRLIFRVGKHTKLSECVTRKAGKQFIKVKWKDGTIAEHRLVYKSELTSVSEQGHLPNVIGNQVPHIEIEVHSCYVLVKLTEIPGLKIWAPR